MLKMLVLTRRVGESVIIDDRVTVSVVSVRGNQVRLGIDAPREISVYREEIFPKERPKPAPEDR